MSRTLMLWLIWLTVSAAGGAYVVGSIVYGGNRSFLLIGKTSAGHHQIELACDTCHTSVFGGPDILQDSCVKCHGAELKLANDSHPLSKFTDPRNADRIEKLDARYCVTCHREHRPKITQTMGVTLPGDFCFHCHSDIAKERPSHANLKFDTCASAGCHNFHDNRALYTEFLLKHGNEKAQLDVQRVALIEYLGKVEDPIKLSKPLKAQDADAPAEHRGNAQALTDWVADIHAERGVNCSGCHTKKTEPGVWIAAPGIEMCSSCHAGQAKTFTEGKHGMRLREGLLASQNGPFGLWSETKLAPMTPAQARLPMKSDAGHKSLTCNTCHSAHEFNRKEAAVTACAGCHNDKHTQAYFTSKHYELFKMEAAGQAPKGSGVSCATCHMPVIEARDEYGTKSILITHNQNDNLRPNEKMVRSTCNSCHGLQFTLDALADRALIEKNFNGVPGVHIESIEWAKRRAKERSEARR
ncbi:MAG: cytochrome c3 family protein [Pseudolabrys sp.]